MAWPKKDEPLNTLIMAKVTARMKADCERAADICGETLPEYIRGALAKVNNKVLSGQL